MASSLSMDVFNSGYKPIPGGPGWDDSTPATWPASTSTLISGDRDAVLTLPLRFGNTVSLRLIRRASESPWSGPELEAALTVAWWMAKARSDLWGPYAPGPQLEYFSRTRRVVLSICAATARDDHPTRRIGCITTKAARPRRTTRPGEERSVAPRTPTHLPAEVLPVPAA